jgi:hypothetical protein
VRSEAAAPRTGAALLVTLVLLLLAAPGAGAAAYYCGGKGVRLAVRVVDRQIVWAKVSVREHCYSTRRGYYEHTEVLDGLILPVAIGRKGAFSWAFKKHTKKGFRLRHRPEHLRADQVGGPRRPPPLLQLVQLHR